MCKYCEGCCPLPELPNQFDMGLSSEVVDVVARLNYNEFNRYYLSIYANDNELWYMCINYCPMCGRKLKNNDKV